MARTENTQSEFLQKMLRIITDAKQAADADMPFLINLETTILNYIKAPMEEAGMEFGQMPGQEMGGAPGGMGASAMGSAPLGGTPVPPGNLRQQPNVGPAVDELRRLTSTESRT